MNRAWTIATIRGIPIRVHVTLLVLFAYIAFVVASDFSGSYARLSHAFGLETGQLVLPPLVWGVLVALGLFCSIVLHELAHCMVALANGLRVESITLMMLGGVSRLQGEFQRPGREAWMAAAGPLTSLLLGVVILGITLLLPGHPPDLTAAGLMLGTTNVVLGIFNLLPAFPMDGGRILRALLATRMGRLPATRRAALVGKIMAVLFAALGVAEWNVILILIAGFIVMGASAETAALEARLLAGRRVGVFADPRIGRVTPETPLWAVAEQFLEDNLVAARVGDGLNGPGAGYITVADLERAGRKAATLRAGDIARRDLPRVWAAADAAAVMVAASSRKKKTVIILEDTGEPIGIVTASDLARAASVADTLQNHRTTT